MGETIGKNPEGMCQMPPLPLQVFSTEAHPALWGEKKEKDKTRRLSLGGSVSILPAIMVPGSDHTDLWAGGYGGSSYKTLLLTLALLLGRVWSKARSPSRTAASFSPRPKDSWKHLVS